MLKEDSVLYSSKIKKTIRTRCLKNPDITNKVIDKAQKWMHLKNDELRSLVFGSTLKRAYHVLSDGNCPVCEKNVPLFNWIVDVEKHPWKVKCPCCGELFPKNDFKKYYRSGLDKRGIFRYEIADESLLYNTENPKKPKFGVDDGNGFIYKGKRWMFVAYYLLWGQWTKLVVDGIKSLSNAYIVSGDKAYAKKAFILLDRVADVFPDYDFMKQGVMYDRDNVDHGYVSYWLVSCKQVKEFALAYDQIFDGIKDDKELILYLSEFSYQKKVTFNDIQEKIEERIFKDALKNEQKIKSNFPETDITVCIIKTVLNMSETNEINNSIENITKQATRVDGLTGEKGLLTYSAHVIWEYTNLLWYFENMNSGFIKSILKRHPALYKTYRFFIDTWCLQKYYPRIGDTGAFGETNCQYALLYWDDYYDHSYMEPSGQTFLWKLYKATADKDFARAIYISNGYSVKNCFEKDLTVKNPKALQNSLLKLIDKHGKSLKQESVNKEQWNLAMLHSGENRENKRVFWMNYETGGSHGHLDGMNIGLYAKGIELLSDFGYPPVHYGWDYGKNKYYQWYKSTAAHNTVTVDGKSHKAAGKGSVTLWNKGNYIKAVTANCPEMINGRRFERTIATVDISNEDSYYIDVFRIQGGTEHKMYIRSTFSEMNVSLDLNQTSGCSHNGCIKDYKTVTHPKTGWDAVWSVDEKYARKKGVNKPVKLKYTSFTDATKVQTALSWIDLWRGSNNKLNTNRMEGWIPTLMVTRKGKKELSSVFSGIFEVYGEKPIIKSIKRIEYFGENEIDFSHIMFEVKHITGTDLIVIKDTKSSAKGYTCTNSENAFFKSDADIGIVRFKEGKLTYACLLNGSYFRSEDIKFKILRQNHTVEFKYGEKLKLIKGGMHNICIS